MGVIGTNLANELGHHLVTNFGCFLSLILQRFVAYLWPTATVAHHCGRWWPNPWSNTLDLRKQNQQGSQISKISLWYKFPSFPFRGVSWDPLFRIPVIFNNPLIRASWIEWIWFGRFSRSKIRTKAMDGHGASSTTHRPGSKQWTSFPQSAQSSFSKLLFFLGFSWASVSNFRGAHLTTCGERDHEPKLFHAMALRQIFAASKWRGHRNS